MAEVVLAFGGPKKSLASDIAKSIPAPGKLRKQQAMKGEEEDDGGNSAAEAAFEALAEAIKTDDAKAGAKAFKLLCRLSASEGEMVEDEDEDGE